MGWACCREAAQGKQWVTEHGPLITPHHHRGALRPLLPQTHIPDLQFRPSELAARLALAFWVGEGLERLLWMGGECVRGPQRARQL